MPSWSIFCISYNLISSTCWRRLTVSRYFTNLVRTAASVSFAYMIVSLGGDDVEEKRLPWHWWSGRRSSGSEDFEGEPRTAPSTILPYFTNVH
jgi:hypothetical protein